MYKLILVLLATLPLYANAESNYPEKLDHTQTISKSLGKYRFELNTLGNRPYDQDTGQAEIQISNSHGQIVQIITVYISTPQPSFDFIDLNGDGYIDLLINTTDRPTPEVFLYIPKLRQFVKSATLSGLGEITKSDKQGCLTVSYERKTDGYTLDEWCFNKTAGRWKQVKSERHKVGT